MLEYLDVISRFFKSFGKICDYLTEEWNWPLIISAFAAIVPAILCSMWQYIVLGIAILILKGIYDKFIKGWH